MTDEVLNKKKGLRRGLLICCLSWGGERLEAFTNREHDGFATADVIVWEDH